MRQFGAWPLAQRNQELDAIIEAFEDPSRDAVVLYGPAGVGKTRLADTCLGLIEARGRLTARVIASQAAALLPLGALAPILPSSLDVGATPAALFERAHSDLLALGDGKPLILFVDDAHLLDTSSAVLLSQLLDTGAVFLVATIRDGETLPDAVGSWWRRTTTLRLDLGDLGVEATGEVLGLTLGGVVGTDTTRRLHVASGGNPLLLRELVQGALDGGQLCDDSGAWRITGNIPPSRRLIDLLAPRLAALSGPARHVVDQLAVCAPLGPAELTGVAGGEVSLDVLEALEHDGLVQVMVEGRRHRLVLAHPLYGEALRAELTVLRRRAILLAAAARIEALGARRREDARRAATWRLDAGGTPDPELLLQAARFARYAHDFTQVERLSSILWAREHTVEVAVLLGEAHYELGHWEEAEAVLAAPVDEGAAEDLLVQRAFLRGQNLQYGLNDWRSALVVVQEARTVIGPDYADDLLAQEGQLWNSAGLPQNALDVIEGLRPDTPRARVLVALVRGQALCKTGRTAEAIEASVEGYREHSALAEPLAMASPGIHFVHQCFALLHAGRFAEAIELARLGYEGSLSQHLPFGQIFFAITLGDALVQQGAVSEARRWFQEGASTAQGHGFDGPECALRTALASVEAMLGNRDEAAAAIARAVELPDFEPLRYYQALGVAWTAWLEGDPERARKVLVANATDAESTGNVGAAAWLWHDAARLGATGVGPHLAALDARGDSPSVTARAHHVQALEAHDAEALGAASEAFEELGMVLLAAEAAAATGDAHRRDGDQRAGSSWGQRARLLTARCPGVRTPGLASLQATVPLSARELEVASLAAQGLTSQEIADRLFLSIRTINNHLGNAYAKLGVHGRDQLADALAPHEHHQRGR